MVYDLVTFDEKVLDSTDSSKTDFAASASFRVL